MFCTQLCAMSTIVHYISFVLFLDKCETMSEDWQLAFRVVTGSKTEVYQLYSGQEVKGHPDRWDDHYKGDLINNWEASTISKARILVERDRRAVAFFEFNVPNGADRTSWFKISNLINSSYDDLSSMSSLSDNSIAGHYRGGTNTLIYRRFHMVRFAGCDNDLYWLSVEEMGRNTTFCSVDTVWKDRVYILYSPGKTGQTMKFQESAGLGMEPIADSMSLYVKAGTVYNVTTLNQTDSKWTVLYRFQSGGNGHFFQLYNNRSFIGTDTPNQNYRNPVMNDWNEFSYSEIEINIIKYGATKAHLIFNGTGSTADTWLNSSRYLTSSFHGVNNVFVYMNVASMNVAFAITSSPVNALCDLLNKFLLVVFDSNRKLMCSENKFWTERNLLLFGSGNTSSSYNDIFSRTGIDVVASTIEIMGKAKEATTLCPCPCIQVSESEIEASMLETKEKLTVKKKTTSVYKRSKISVEDERTSAQAVGYVGAFLLAIPCVLLISLDLISVLQKLQCIS